MMEDECQPDCQSRESLLSLSLVEFSWLFSSRPFDTRLEIVGPIFVRHTRNRLKDLNEFGFCLARQEPCSYGVEETLPIPG